MIGLAEMIFGITYCSIKAGKEKVKETKEKRNYKKVQNIKAEANGWNIVECDYVIES